MATKSDALQKSLEHVQDYLGVSAHQLWHQECDHVVRFLLHMEEHDLLRRRLPAPSSSPHHDPSSPIAFPDACAAANSSARLGGSFISRTGHILMALSEPKVAAGGLHGEWLSSSSQSSTLLDSLVFETMRRALGSIGVAAVSRWLSLRAAGSTRKVLNGCATLLDSQDSECRKILKQVLASSSGGGSAMSKAMKSASSRLSQQVIPLSQAISRVGQIALLRRKLTGLLRLRWHLDASLTAGALAVLDATALAESLELEADAAEATESQLPSLWDFVKKDGEESPEEMSLRFRRRLVRAGELPGLADPLRQLLRNVPEGSVRSDVGILLALTLVSSAASTAQSAPAVDTRRKSFFDAFSSSSVQTSTGNASSSSANKANVALAAGLASLLHQLPRKVMDALLQMSGDYLGALMIEVVEEKGDKTQAFAEGAQIIDLLGETLQLLGFPREHLADFVPQGLLDLWPTD
eukprot:TRINITY_DN33762_c0_g1_i1.p1 TRINITY_DN33762_c0_g1~~TRINITY_DN33762_c0_g1_i1.p1  ORF type:complete len:481 (+),score=75.01 TRINITY_DN33762_c0_g1_i1:48-1445(+)